MRGLLRLAAGLALIAVAVAVALFFAGRPGSVHLIWLGHSIDTSVAVLVVLLLILVILLWVLSSGLFWLLRTPARASQRRRDRRRLSGYRILTDGLVALAAGDARQAEKLKQRAELLFEQSDHAVPPLARLLAAQVALLRNDEKAAKAEFTAMLDSPETEFLGLRGLIVQAMKAGEDEEALKLTVRANRLRPRTPWVLQSQLALETRASDWRAAQETLKTAVKQNILSPEQGRSFKATLLIAHSRQAARDGWTRDALSYAAQAHGLDLGFAPAAIHYAESLGASDRRTKALKILESSWSAGGHPAVAAAYDRLLGAEAPATRFKRFERLTELRPGDATGHIAAAGLALQARLWSEARQHLDRAGAAGPGPWPKQLCHLMAELDTAERGDARAARQWLERAAHAPEDPLWVCTTCGAETHDWTPLCASCHSFDSLSWRTPDRAAAKPIEPIRAIGHDTLLDISSAGGSSAALAAGEAAEAAARGGP
ncbi:MAG TPA: heme biosynthesis HemY N-terminal domain-containing protein [Aliidongia sp.]|nr:heme biosynthesis HemY N-terminal domain-containing protein [Aliidongia sp.]